MFTRELHEAMRVSDHGVEEIRQQSPLELLSVGDPLHLRGIGSDHTVAHSVDLALSHATSPYPLAALLLLDVVADHVLPDKGNITALLLQLPLGVQRSSLSSVLELVLRSLLVLDITHGAKEANYARNGGV